MSIEWKVPPQQPEAIRWPRILTIIATVLSIFASVVGIVWWFGYHESHEINPRPSIPPELSEAQINLLNQVPFPIAQTGYLLRDEHLRELESYGWVDPARGRIHVPVDVVMRRMAEEASKER